MKTKTIWRVKHVSVGYTGIAEWYGNSPGNYGPIKDKLFESRKAAEEYIEPLARKRLETEIKDFEETRARCKDTPQEELYSLKADCERLGGFQVEVQRDKTIYWGPKPEHDTCRVGTIMASVEIDELVLKE